MLSREEKKIRKKKADREHYLKNRAKIIRGSTEWNKKNRAYHREYDRKWRQKYPHKRRESYLKRAYKLSLFEFERLKIAQHGKCAICGETVSRLVIDHCHKTHKVRGLLCTTCNAGIGQLKESIGLLANAIAYLKSHEIT